MAALGTPSGSPTVLAVAALAGRMIATRRDWAAAPARPRPVRRPVRAPPPAGCAAADP
jgi:hypothetical protein